MIYFDGTSLETRYRFSSSISTFHEKISTTNKKKERPVPFTTVRLSQGAGMGRRVLLSELRTEELAPNIPDGKDSDLSTLLLNVVRVFRPVYSSPLFGTRLLQNDRSCVTETITVISSIS